MHTIPPNPPTKKKKKIHQDYYDEISNFQFSISSDFFLDKDFFHLNIQCFRMNIEKHKTWNIRFSFEDIYTNL